MSEVQFSIFLRASRDWFDKCLIEELRWWNPKVTGKVLWVWSCWRHIKKIKKLDVRVSFIQDHISILVAQVAVINVRLFQCTYWLSYYTPLHSTIFGFNNNSIINEWLWKQKPVMASRHSSVQLFAYLKCTLIKNIHYKTLAYVFNTHKHVFTSPSLPSLCVNFPFLQLTLPESSLGDVIYRHCTSAL